VWFDPGWNSDEPAVVELVGQRILRLLFVKEDAAHSIAEFLDLLELAAAGNPLRPFFLSSMRGALTR
jgi:hypothetical protein